MAVRRPDELTTRAPVLTDWGIVTPTGGPAYKASLADILGLSGGHFIPNSGINVGANPAVGEVVATSAGAGNIDLYTVPAGKTVIILALTGYNTTAGSLTVSPRYKYGSTYVQVGSNSIAGAGAITNVPLQGPMVFSEGETVAVNSTGAGVLFVLRYVEIDTGRFVPVFGKSLAVGDNLLYTCPVGKRAALLATTLTMIGLGVFGLSNSSGSTRVVAIKRNASLISGSISSTSGSITQAGCVGVTLAPGDTLSINSDGVAAADTFLAFGAVYEF